MTPEQLDEYLEVLRDHNVAEFSCPEFSVSLLPAAPRSAATVAADIKEGNESVRAPARHGAFSHPSLWPNGTPPSFPKAERGEKRSEAVRADHYEGEF